MCKTVSFLKLIVNFFSAGPKEAQVLVYEYVQNGSLLEYIVGKSHLVNIQLDIKL